MAAIGAIKDLFANCRTFEETKLAEKIQLALDSPNAQTAEFPGELTVIKGLIGMFDKRPRMAPRPFPKSTSAKALVSALITRAIVCKLRA
jgi:hypothetical protein